MDRRVTPPTYVSSNVSSYLFQSTKSLQVFLEKKREIEWGISRFRTRGHTHSIDIAAVGFQ